MLLKRIIPCLDVDKGRVVKGVKYVDHVDAARLPIQDDLLHGPQSSVVRAAASRVRPGRGGAGARGSARPAGPPSTGRAPGAGLAASASILPHPSIVGTLRTYMRICSRYVRSVTARSRGFVVSLCKASQETKRTVGWLWSRHAHEVE